MHQDIGILIQYIADIEMVVSKNSSSRDPLLFDIRLQSTEDGIILLKGSPEEASSIFLSGTIVVSVQQPIYIKNLTLRLNGRILMHVPITTNTPKGSYTRYTKFQKRFYHHQWDDFNIKNYFANLYDNYGKAAIESESNVSKEERKATENLLKRKRAKSTNSILSFTGTSSNASSNYHTLVRGNYEFPFTAILPGSLTESVEGHPNATVMYYLEAVIERPKQSDLISKKHLRVIRTLRPDALELTETISVDNTWPEKVEYSISIPSKAVPIGSSSPIDISITPLMKGLKLGPVKVQLVEVGQLCSATGVSSLDDRLVSKTKIKDPFGHLAKLRKKKYTAKSLTDPNFNTGSDDDSDMDFQDKWDINTTIEIPPNLLACVQDCTVLNNVKIRHKLKFVICLINPDGHMSELRASLPIQLFISPFVPIKTKSPEAIERDIKLYGTNYANGSCRPTITIGRSSGNNSPIIQQESTFSNNDNSGASENEDLIFSKSLSAVELSSMNVNTSESVSSLNGLMVPPNYANHVYDRLWNGRMSPVDVVQKDTEPSFSPDNRSGYSTPVANRNNFNVEQLQGSLQNLVIENEQEGTNENETQQLTAIQQDMLLASPSLEPDYVHISRSASFSRLASSASLKSDWQVKDLTSVPSYDRAMKSDLVGDDLPPAYPDEDNQDSKDAIVLERPQFIHQKSNSSLNVPGRRYSHNFSRSNNSSSTSLNNLSMATSGYGQNLGVNNYNKGSTASKKFAFEMTPVDSNHNFEESHSSIPMERASSRASLNSNHRSGSFASLVELFTKKR